MFLSSVVASIRVKWTQPCSDCSVQTRICQVFTDQRSSCGRSIPRICKLLMWECSQTQLSFARHNWRRQQNCFRSNTDQRCSSKQLIQLSPTNTQIRRSNMCSAWKEGPLRALCLHTCRLRQHLLWTTVLSETLASRWLTSNVPGSAMEATKCESWGKYPSLFSRLCTDLELWV